MKEQIKLEALNNYYDAAAAATRLEEKEENPKVGFFVRLLTGGYAVVRIEKV